MKATNNFTKWLTIKFAFLLSQECLRWHFISWIYDAHIRYASFKIICNDIVILVYYILVQVDTITIRILLFFPIIAGKLYLKVIINKAP